MRALVQRVGGACVTVGGRTVGSIGTGLLIYLGVARTDDGPAGEWLAERCARLRIFDDGSGKMNHSVIDAGGSALVVSQFTLYADTRHGHRPGFSEAAPPEQAEPLYEEFVRRLRLVMGEGRVTTGVFREMMDVISTNTGPVTIMLESKQT